MKLIYKRIFIIFSVALNIGFLIMAVSMYFNHSPNLNKKSAIYDIVQELKLNETQESEFLELIHKLRISVEKQETEINNARNEILRLASNPEPFDQNQSQHLSSILNQKEIVKNKLFNDHITEVRNLLGNQKAAQYYSLILDHIKKSEKTRRR